MPADLLSETNWKDFEEPIIGTLILNFFITDFGQVLPHGITYFGKVLPHGNISDDEIEAKLVCLDTGYSLWANTAKDAVKKLNDILSVMEEIRSPESIKKYLDSTRDATSLPLATSNGPFGAYDLSPVG